MSSTVRLAAALLVAGFLAGCSSGGDRAGRPPVADAGAAQVVLPGLAVVIDGSGSSDPDGDALTYAWTLPVRPAGSAASLVTATGQQTSLVADVPGTYVVMLVVSDGRHESAPALALVTAGDGGGATRPVAFAGPDVSTWAGHAVSLDGGASWDPLGRPFTYLWTVSSKPAGSAPLLTGASGPYPTFTADQDGSYIVTLTVAVAGGASAVDAVVVTVANPAPVASAGGDRAVALGTTITLQGAGSDPDGTPVTFAWTIVSAPAGSTATLSAPTTATPSLTPDRAGTWILELTVSNASGQATARATLSVADPPPVAAPVVTRAAYVGQATSFDAHASSPDGTPLTFAWTMVSRPAGSAAALASTDLAVTSFVPDVAGAYRLSLVVSDPGAALPAFTIDVTAWPALTPLPHRVGDAEYSKALDAIVMVDDAPSALYRYDVADGSEHSVALALPPTSVSVSPDGLFAAAGHNGWVSYVDLTAMSVVKVIATTADVLDVVLAGNGFAYAFPRIDQWSEIHCLELSSGVETLSAGWSIYAGTRARLHPGGAAIYGADNGLSPSDIEKYGISGGTAAYLYDSPYHGDYAMCGNLWFSEDGARIFTACGNVFRATSVRETDMTYNGALQGTTGVRHLSHSSAAGEVAVATTVPWYQGTGNEDQFIRLFDEAYLTQRPSVRVAPFIRDEGSFAGKARFVFYRADGGARYALVQAAPESAMLHDYAVMPF